MARLPSILCIVGPTASGKTALGIKLAKQFGGEIINADARQIYRSLNIGTGKPPGKRGKAFGHPAFLVEGIPHYLMGFLAPQEIFTVAQWCRCAKRAIAGITKRGHLPMIVGGTGLYIQALVDNYQIPSVPPQQVFRKAMESKTLFELIDLLRLADPDAVGLVDIKNRPRVLRALEVTTFTGEPFSRLRSKAQPLFDACLIGRSRAREELHMRIDQALEEMFRAGWVEEVKMLQAKGLSLQAPAMTSIGYKEIGACLRGEMTLEEATKKTKQATNQYAKRQITWFKRDKRIHWIKDEAEAEEIVQRWLHQKKKKSKMT